MSGRADFLFDGPLGARPRAVPTENAPAEKDSDELSCSAYGFLRGLHERSLSLELRFRNGDREAYPYALLAAVRFNPSVGILLKFTGDLVTLVLISGSNLDLPVHQGAADLIERGLLKNRVVWVREMDEDELRQADDRGPTVDGILVAECETQEEVREWLGKTAPAFLRP